ncbi:Lipid-translocating exporter-like protein RTA1 [Pseudocercospora fuligena]|uniref:Lipid-translocating exporter-like protein RTA1 n=1 Tax=Pseudocercospora fuligena TaxID=685502 RepID=A0A8H6RNI6_9PEZI|nr:Lipid-translocating exporter-like protein RTA1 [Pseudocercospora fuligena]
MTDTTDDWSLFPYDPNKPAPIAFAILLTCLACLQFYQSFFQYKWKKFGGVMTGASSVWIAGFVCRSISVYNVQSVNIFIAQYVLVLMGPPLYAASEYFILGRLLAYLPYHTPIHPGRVYSTFIFLSTVVETLTANGAANSVGDGRTEAQYRTGHNLLKSALILQCFVEALFMSLVATVEYRCRKAKSFPRPIRTVCYILYITSGMILVRCIVRTIEGFEAASCDPNSDLPYCGSVSRNEWFLWVFEIANITLFVILLSIFHPGRFLPGSSKVFLDPDDGKTERLGPGFGKADKRPLLITIVDPFNFYGIATGKGMKLDKFWERHQPLHDSQDVKSKSENLGGPAEREEIEIKKESTSQV